MAKQIKFKLLPNGQIQAETVGMKGSECLNYIDLMTKLTKSEVIKNEYTSEYYEKGVQKIDTSQTY